MALHVGAPPMFFLLSDLAHPRRWYSSKNPLFLVQWASCKPSRVLYPVKVTLQWPFLHTISRPWVNRQRRFRFAALPSSGTQDSNREGFHKAGDSDNGRNNDTCNGTAGQTWGWLWEPLGVLDTVFMVVASHVICSQRAVYACGHFGVDFSECNR